ncbi:SDR family NAD(P)-dependent oxidoreductase [Agrococcus sp. SGAir0287]|uniref:SDR family NAD(P)-dependent oxidoreductase n=1 Tax=Agrococcus sp. SGAir0287 TaxID=2070347 RepID=UPI0010CCDC36|nr:SDR family NAD(P)-dependent oxidoreductase [Agrococcus sp. SGAir0287]QCR19120.1 shikimate dehydrogenase [Agrococcus sp. SGAir0287]
MTLALVTGAGRGIGRAIVQQLVDREHRVIATARRLDVLEGLRSEVVETALVDLDADDVGAQTIPAIAERPLDLLVLNAARFSPWDERAADADLDVARGVLATNVLGSWAVVQAALPALRAARGTIVGVGSGSGSHGDPQFGLAVNPGAASYAVSRAALHALLHRLSAELAPDGIRVFATDPGLTATAPGMVEMGARPVEDGARSVLAPLDGRVEPGTLARDGRPLPW